MGSLNDYLVKEKLIFLNMFEFLKGAMRSQLINLMYEIKLVKPNLNKPIY